MFEQNNKSMWYSCDNSQMSDETKIREMREYVKCTNKVEREYNKKRK